MSTRFRPPPRPAGHRGRCVALALALLALAACDDLPEPQIAPPPPATDGRDPAGDYASLERETLEPFDNVAGTEPAPPYSRNNPQAVADDRLPPLDTFDTSPDADPAPRASIPVDRVEEAFRRLDANADGVLTADEFAALGAADPAGAAAP